MEKLRAYLDESGVGEGDSQATSLGFVFSAAGFIASTDDWAKFADKWNSILLGEGLPDPPVFHMRDFLHSRRDFDRWQPDRTGRVLGSLVDAINTAPILGHASVIIRGEKRDWDKTLSRFPMARGYVATGYSHCIHALTTKAQMILGTEEKIDFVCGQNQEQAKLLDIFEAMRDAREFELRQRLGSITFESPRHLPPLQACDLLAYEARRRAIDEADQRPERRSLVRLESAKKVTFSRHDSSQLTRLITKVTSDPGYPALCEEMDRAKRERLRGKKSTS